MSDENPQLQPQLELESDTIARLMDLVEEEDAQALDALLAAQDGVRIAHELAALPAPVRQEIW
ncbi:MAG TPA: hypothetical protein PLN94_12820, partial [Thiolinea sp.]|nr:hypothetical protein [Thiolinea sp.]